MLNKIKTIVLSRIKKPKTESWVNERRAICKKCEWNSLNIEKLSFKVRFIKFFSDSYSWITGNKKVDTLGVCSICTCSLYYKTLEQNEQCAYKPSKWSRIWK